MDHLGIKLDLKLYPYRDVGRPAAARLDPARAGREPEILFLDEPFSALDYEMTLFMREQLQRIFMETGTMILVSHDLEEAVYLADRVLCCRVRRASRIHAGAGEPAAHRRHAVDLDFVASRRCWKSSSAR